MVYTFQNTLPISRFLATEYGLTGRTSLEAAQADEIVDALTDIVNTRVRAVFEPDEAKKAEKMQAYLSDTLPTGLVSCFIIRHIIKIHQQQNWFIGPHGKVAC